MNQHKCILLGVNIDHVATLRKARHTRYPDPVEAVFAAALQSTVLILAIHRRVRNQRVVYTFELT